MKKVFKVFLIISLIFTLSSTVFAEFLIEGPQGLTVDVDGQPVTLGADGSVSSIGGTSIGSGAPNNAVSTGNSGVNGTGSGNSNTGSATGVASGNTRTGTSNSSSTPTLNYSGFDVTSAFSSLDSLGGTGDQFDLHGIYMSKNTMGFGGNRTYLGNDEKINEFYQFLDYTKYDTDFLKITINKLKDAWNIITQFFEGKDYMVRDYNAMTSMEQRRLLNELNRLQGIINFVSMFLGIFLLFYGFILVVSWVVDKSFLPIMAYTGILQDGILSFITFGKMVADDDDFGPNSTTFTKVFIFACICVAVGIFIISPVSKELLGNLISWINVNFLNKLPS